MGRVTSVIGIDLGGTKIAAGLVTAGGTIRHAVRIASEAHLTKARVMKNLEQAIASCLAAGDARIIGIGAAGSVDREKGIFRGGANMPRDWNDVPLKRLLEKKFRRVVVMDNDVHAIALAEQRWGKARGKSSAFILMLGTGIGGAFLVEGNLIRGAHNNASEVGHMVISDRHIRCACGNEGHFEALVGGKALVRAYAKKTGVQKSTYDIARDVRKNKRDAIAVVNDMRRSLAVGIANIIRAYDPEVCIIGGGMAEIPGLVRGLPALVSPLLSHRAYPKSRILLSSIRHTAGILGGAALTMTPKNR